MSRIEDLKWAIKNEQRRKRDEKLAFRYKREDHKAELKKIDRQIAKAKKELKKLTKV